MSIQEIRDRIEQESYPEQDGPVDNEKIHLLVLLLETTELQEVVHG